MQVLSATVRGGINKLQFSLQGNLAKNHVRKEKFLEKFKRIAVLFTLLSLTCNLAAAPSESGHEWKEFRYFGASAGAHGRGDDENTYFLGGVFGLYHNQLSHTHPDVWGIHLSDWGVIGSASYFSGPTTDFSLTALYARGLWLDRRRLLLFALGPSWSEFNGWGVSSMAVLSYVFRFSDNSINSGAVFIQSEGYPGAELSPIQWRFSLSFSLGMGVLNQVWH